MYSEMFINQHFIWFRWFRCFCGVSIDIVWNRDYLPIVTREFDISVSTIWDEFYAYSNNRSSPANTRAISWSLYIVFTPLLSNAIHRYTIIALWFFPITTSKFMVSFVILCSKTDVNLLSASTTKLLHSPYWNIIFMEAWMSELEFVYFRSLMSV